MRIKNKLPKETLLNQYTAEYLVYIDLTDFEVKVDDEEKVRVLEEEKKALIFPYKEGLAPFGKTLEEFLSANEIDIPSGDSPMRYLKECGMNGYFQEYQNVIINQAFDNWCLSKEIEFEDKGNKTDSIL